MLAVVFGTGLEKTLELGLCPFVPGDTFKLYVAAALLPAASRSRPKHTPRVAGCDHERLD